jgi:hypothetical protein
MGPTLRHPSILDAGEYPGHETESAWIADDRRRLSGIAMSILQAQVPEEHQRERMRRLIAYWGSDADMETRADDGGGLDYAGIGQGVYEAFGLPWLGGESAVNSERSSPVPPKPEDPRGERPDSPTEKPAADRGRSAAASNPPGSPRTTPSRPRTVARSELQRLQGDIAAWREGRQIANPVKLNTLPYEILREIPWRHLGISEWMWNRFITQETVILKGTKPARAPHLVIPNEEWAGQGLEAYAALKIAGNNPGSSAEEAYLCRYAALIRRLGSLLEAHVRRRLPTQPDGEPSITFGMFLAVFVSCAAGNKIYY